MSCLDVLSIDSFIMHLVTSVLINPFLARSSVFLHPQTIQESLSLGFTCAVNSSFTFLPHLAARIFSMMEAGDKDGAVKEQQRLTSCFDVIFRQSKAGVREGKCFLSRGGRCGQELGQGLATSAGTRKRLRVLWNGQW